MNTTAELMPEVLKKIGVTTENFEFASLLEQGLSQVSKTAKIVGFRKNCFYVEVESSAELHELYLRKKEILKMMQSFKTQEKFWSVPEIKFLLSGMVSR